MKLPSATSVAWTCPRCHETRSVPEGDRVPPCLCATKPPSERNTVDIYERVSDTTGPRFFALALPLGERPVKAFSDTEQGAVNQVNQLLDIDWKSDG